MLGVFWPIQDMYVVGEAFCDVKNLLSPNKFTLGDLMNIESLVINVTAVGSSDRAEHAIFGMILAVRFLAIQAVFATGEPLSDGGTASLALITLLRVI